MQNSWVKFLRKANYFCLLQKYFYNLSKIDNLLYLIQISQLTK